MSQRVSIVSMALILVIGATVVAGLWFFKPEPQRRPPVKPMPPVVTFISAEPETYQAYITAQGTVEPKRRLNVIAEVSGQVKEVGDHFVEGGHFSAGESLLKLDDRDYRIALERAKAQVANAERDLALELGQARQAKRVWRDLGSRDANELFLREPQVRAARANVQAAKADLQAAQLNVDRTEFSMPFNGRIQNINVELGQFVAAGSTIAVVFDDNAAEVRLPISGLQLVKASFNPSETPEVLAQIPVQFEASIGGQVYQWLGHLSHIEAAVDSKTRLFYVVGEIDQPFNLERHAYPLTMGLFVEARIQGKSFENVIAIPKKAVLNNRVFVINSEQQLELKDVTVVDSDDKNSWVHSAIAAGEKIVTSDPRVLQEGQAVRTKE